MVVVEERLAVAHGRVGGEHTAGKAVHHAGGRFTVIAGNTGKRAQIVVHNGLTGERENFAVGLNLHAFRVLGRTAVLVFAAFGNKGQIVTARKVQQSEFLEVGNGVQSAPDLPLLVRRFPAVQEHTVGRIGEKIRQIGGGERTAHHFHHVAARGLAASHEHFTAHFAHAHTGKLTGAGCRLAAVDVRLRHAAAQQQSVRNGLAHLFLFSTAHIHAGKGGGASAFKADKHGRAGLVQTVALADHVFLHVGGHVVRAAHGRDFHDAGAFFFHGVFPGLVVRPAGAAVAFTRGAFRYGRRFGVVFRGVVNLVFFRLLKRGRQLVQRRNGGGQLFLGGGCVETRPLSGISVHGLSSGVDDFSPYLRPVVRAYGTKRHLKKFPCRGHAHGARIFHAFHRGRGAVLHPGGRQHLIAYGNVGNVPFRHTPEGIRPGLHAGKRGAPYELALFRAKGAEAAEHVFHARAVVRIEQRHLPGRRKLHAVHAQHFGHNVPFLPVPHVHRLLRSRRELHAALRLIEGKRRTTPPQRDRAAGRMENVRSLIRHCCLHSWLPADLPGLQDCCSGFRRPGRRSRRARPPCAAIRPADRAPLRGRLRGREWLPAET